MWANDVAPGGNSLGVAAKLIFLPPQLLPKNEQGAHFKIQCVTAYLNTAFSKRTMYSLLNYLSVNWVLF